ncbi:MAG TPA: GAF domain-containing protein [Vicinamibacterales bacterium]
MRVTFAAIAWLALAGAAVFLIYSEKQLHQDRIVTRAFDAQAREATEALSDLRAAQQAYVAAGQGIAFWMPKVSTTSAAAAKTISSLQPAAASGDAKTALDQAASTLNEFDSVDKRARDYIKSGQELMAADVVFTEGGQLAATAARQVEAARMAEHQTLDLTEASARKLEAAVAGGAAGFAGLLLLLLAPKARTPQAADDDRSTLGLNPSPTDERSAVGELPVRTADATRQDAATRARAVSPVLKAAASLCTDFGRVRDVGDLNQLLARVADVMDAKGLIVWLGTTGGDDLQPVLAHGYAPQKLAKMPTIPRSADNAAGSAYRTGQVQIVVARPGTSQGAIVAPLLATDGCIGALSVEIQDGGEESDSVQALAAIFAAQLAPIMAGSAVPAESAAPVRAMSQ